jgi:hypothetical protein
MQALSACIEQQELLQPLWQQLCGWAQQQAMANLQDVAAPAADVAELPDPQGPLPQDAGGIPPPAQPQQQPMLHAYTPAETVAPGLLPPRPPVASGTGYMLRILQSVTMQDVQQALLMTPESMQELNIQLFKRLAALTELAARPAYDADADAGNGDALTDNSDAHQGINSSGDQQQQQQVHNSSNGEAAHPASTAAPAVRVGAASGTDPAASLDETLAASLRTAHAAAFEHVEAYVNYANRLFILVQLHNPIALYAVAVNNLITNEPAVAPSSSGSW